MPAGHKNFLLRGGVDEADFPSRHITMKNVRTVSRIAWEKWGPLIADYPLRDLISLAYAEGLYHGAMILHRDQILPATTGTTAALASSAAGSACGSETTKTELPSVRDLLDSL